ncbi:MAG: protein translocase subunit SecD [Patescibacteria group bacterium]
MRKYPGLILSFIFVATIIAGFFVYPGTFGLKTRPWRLGLDLVGGSHLIYEIDLTKIPGADQSSVVNGLRDVIERRVNLFGVSEPQVFTAKSGNKTNLIVEIAGITDINQAIRLIGETPLLDFREVVENGSSTTFVTPETPLTGQYITSAQLTFDQTTGAPQVSISFNDEGSKIFENLTEKNVNKPIAIFLDEGLIEAPVVQQKITGGQAVITGRFTVSEARTLVERFNAGALPAPITLINQQTVSPGLGNDSLQKALTAGAIGTLIVMLFMLVYYQFFGVFAAVALIIYSLLTLGLFKLIGVTMTLAGLAGFILTIGMAVDANILIFERVKEETKKGLSRMFAIEEGFKKAWPSIRDSNISTIITAVILYFFTSSFIKGFALTLLIGVLVSMFSAITTTRLLLKVFAKNQPATKN